MRRPVLTSFLFSVRIPTLLAIFWRTHVKREPPPDLIRRGRLSFIIFRLDALGDVILTTPLFHALKTTYPESRCTVVVQSGCKPLLVTNPHIDEILTLPTITASWLPRSLRRWLSAAVLYWTHLRSRHFDFAVSPRWDVDEHLATFLCALTHATNRVGYTERTSAAKQQLNRGFDRAYTNCLPPGPVRHEILRNLAVAKALGAREFAAPEIYLTEPDRRRADRILAKVPPTTSLIAIGIGAGTPNRRWPLGRYAEVVKQLSKMRSLQPVIVGSAAEAAEAMKLADMLESAPIIVNGAGLREVCAVLERCELFIGNDSGSAHLAAAMNCRVIVISRHPQDGEANHSNSPLRFAPQCTHARVLQPLTGLEGCRGACRSSEPHCITRVSVDEVVAAARSMLNRKRALRTQAQVRALTDNAIRHLLQSHSAEGVQRAIEMLRAGTPPLISV